MKIDLSFVASATLIGGTIAHVQVDHDSTVECQIPEQIPNGRRLFRHSLRENFRDYSEPVDTNLHVGQWIGYQCNADSDLVFSHNHQPATTEDCMRQCYVPTEHECNDDRTGVRDATDNFERLNPIALLDPMNCYCRQRRCPRVTDQDLHGSHVFLDESDKDRDFWPVPGFNQVQVMCAPGTFSDNRGNGIGRVETIECDLNGWSAPSSCYTTGCPNPRSNAQTFFAESLSVDHTYSDMDLINLNPSDVNSQWLNMGANGNGVVWADSHRLPFNFPRDSEAVYRVDNLLDNTVSNVRDGATARFFCKNGYHPYYNANVARDHLDSPQTMGPQVGSSFDCSCNNGKWECTMHCRCEGFCPDEHVPVSDHRL
jgi:hypothetical protein